MKRTARFAALILAAGLGVVALAAALVVVLATTSFGARLALQVGADRVPGALTVGEVSGSLLDGLELADVRYRANGLDARIDMLSAVANLGALLDRRVELTAVHVRGGTVTLTGDDDPAGGDDAVDDTADAPATERGAPPADTTETAPLRAGELPTLPDSVAIRELHIENLLIDGVGETPIRVVELAGSVNGPELTIGRAAITTDGAMLVAAADATLGPDRAFGTLVASAELSAGRQSAEVDAAFELIGGENDEPWRAAVEWSALEWRRPDAPAITSRDGRLTVRPILGEADAGLGADAIGAEQPRTDSPDADPPADAGDRGASFAVELDTAIEGEPLPEPARLTASAAVSAEQIDVHGAEVAMAGIEAVASGALRLDTRSGYISLDYRGVDPSLVDPRMSGTLRGRADAAVSAEPALRAAGTAEISGELDGRPLDGRITASYADDTLSIERADVALDDGRIELVGALSPDYADLHFAASLPRLAAWYPPISGALTASGSIAGDTDDPAVSLELEATDLEWEAAAAPPLEHVRFAIDGTRAAHALRLETQSELGHIAVEVEQHYADSAVTGVLGAAVLEPPRVGVWRLDEPAAYAATLDSLRIEPACLIGPEDARLCIELADERLAVDAREVPHTLAQPWLPDELRVSGTSDVQLDLTLAAPLEGSGLLHARTLTVITEDDAGTLTRVLELPDLTLRATLDPGALALELDGRARGAADDTAADAAFRPSSIDGHVTLMPPSVEGSLDGELLVGLTDLRAVDALVDGIEDLTGALDARIAIAGTLDEPSLAGVLAAAELAARLPPLGIEVTDGRLGADLADFARVPFEGELCSGGCARLYGTLSLPPDGAWSITADVDGEEVLLVDLPDLRAVASSRLDVNVTPELARASGTLRVVEGSIEVEGVPRSAIRPAAETVVHGRPEPDREDQGLPFPLALNVRATLGDVTFSGLGVTAQLDGALDVEHTVGGRWNVQGTTTIEEGTFTAYGQTLVIERGVLIFTGPPENPALDIRATRIVDDNEVSLLISGTARDPRSEVASAAGLPESEAFAQLVTGRSLGNLDEADSDTLERAALGLGLRRALPTLGRIGESLGLDELGIDSPGTEGGAVIAGRQLGEDVYLRYRFGLFDDFSGLELIYRITDHFRLRTETGTAQAIDLIYELERGGVESLQEDVEDIDVAIQDRGATPEELLEPEFE